MTMNTFKDLASRLLRVGAVLTAAALFGTAAAAETYKVGTTAAPYGFTDPQTGQATGYSVDVMKAIAADAGFDVEFTVFTTFGELLPAVLNGTVDIGASSTTLTTQRIDSGLAYTGIYARHGDVMAVPTSDTGSYTSWDDFAGQSVGGSGGTIYLDYLNKLQAAQGLFKEVVDTTAAFPGMSNADAGAEALRTGRVKATMGANFVWSYQRLLGKAADIRVVESYVPVLPSATGLVVRRDDVELLGLIQRSLSKLIADGTVAKIADDWGIIPP
jgi:ABC-type amino acid transport substrate-binding protein